MQEGNAGGPGPVWRPGPPSYEFPVRPSWTLPRGPISLERPVVMGIVNLTPDSFSDGGRFRDVEEALAEAETMVEAGAGLIDVGGESTRPGADLVPADEERRRILPFIERGAERLSVPISVDTRKASVARAAFEAGAEIVNDVSGLAYDPAMGEVVAQAGAGAILMHMRGEPATMKGLAHYDDVPSEVAAELAVAVERARAAGIDEDAIVLDPGIGFAKDASHSYAVLAHLGALLTLGLPVLVGPSRKSFIGSVVESGPTQRTAGTVAACVAAYLQGARVFRVHDVEPVIEALAVAEAIARAGKTGEPVGEEQ